jgi:hypothetical protein
MKTRKDGMGAGSPGLNAAVAGPKPGQTNGHGWPQIERRRNMKTDTQPLSWRETFRRGIVPQLSRRQLERLRKAVADNDPRLLQGATTQPPPLQCVQDWPVEAACLMGFCGWMPGDTAKDPCELETVADVEEAFAQMAFRCDEMIGIPAGCRFFMNPYDDWTREEMRLNLLPEIDRAIAALAAKETDTPLTVDVEEVWDRR